MSDHPRTARYEAGRAAPSGYEPTNLADVLDRILDKGLVIAGDISISLAQVELITIKIRLLLASADKAKEMGIDWWTRDPSLSGGAVAQGDGEGGDVEEENRALRQRVADLEQKLAGMLTGGESVASRSEPINAADLIALNQQSTQPAPPAPRRRDDDDDDEADEADDDRGDEQDDETDRGDEKDDKTDRGDGSDESSKRGGSGGTGKSSRSRRSSKSADADADGDGDGGGDASDAADGDDAGGDASDAADGEEAGGSSGDSDDGGGYGQRPEG